LKKNKPSKPKEQITSSFDMILTKNDLLETNLVHNSMNSYFKSDGTILNVETLIKKKFRGWPINENINRNRLRNNKSSKFLFVNPCDEWARPPSLSLDGYSIVSSHPPSLLGNGKSSLWFELKYSPDYTKLNNELLIIQNSGDANKLLIFLSQFPYHLEGLLQISMLFARLGDIGRAFDILKRALYCLEYRFPDMFQPTQGLGCRMDPNIPSNHILFQIFYRYMQVITFQGFPSVASNIGLMLLGLYPFEDKYHLLLTLDYLFISSNKYDDMINFCGINLAQVSSLPLWQAINQEWRLYPFITQQESIFSIYLSKHGCKDNHDYNQTGVSVMFYMPNWWFSIALGMYLKHLKSLKPNIKQSELNTTTSSSSSAQFVTQSDYDYEEEAKASKLLQMALLKWPFVLSYIMKTANISDKSMTWRDILSHALFDPESIRSRISSDNVLLHIANLYSVRTKSLWSRGEITAWLCVNAQGVLKSGLDVVTVITSISFRNSLIPS
jgi:hypothetical protein